MKRRQVTGFRLQVIGIIAAIILIARSAAFADVVLVPDFRVDQDPTPNTVSDVASSLLHSYFVVTYTYMTAPAKCYARRFDLSGNALGDAFQVAPSPSRCYGATIDTNGNMAFLYPCFPGGVQHVCVRRFDINETPLDAGVQVDQSADIASGIAIESLPGGGYVVGYANRAGVDWDTYARIYDSSGNPVGDEFRVDQNPDVNDNYGASNSPVVATSPSGRIFIAWVDARIWGDITWGAVIFARIFDSSGNPVGNDFRVDQNNGWGACFQMPKIAAAPNNNFVVVWDDYRDGEANLEDCVTGSPDIFMRTFDTDGTPLTNDIKVNTEPIFPEYEATLPDITFAPSGRGMIVWLDSRPGGGVYGRHINSIGQLLDADFRVDGGNPGYVCSNAPAGNNSFVTGWWDTRMGTGQVWANITGPDSNIPVASPLILGILAVILLIFLLIITKFRWKINIFAIIVTIVVASESSHATQCIPGDCDATCPNYVSDDFSTTCDSGLLGGCNRCIPNTIGTDYDMTLVYGNMLYKENRRNIFFVGEGWETTPQKQAIFNEQVNALIESIKFNPTWADYFEFFNYYRINIYSPDSGADFTYDNVELAMNHLVFDNEDQSIFSTTGEWFNILSNDSFSGQGYHITTDTSASATWRFVMPATLGSSNSYAIFASWPSHGGWPGRYTSRSRQ